MRRLMGHLAQFSSFSKQGEVLCTQGLKYLLENSDARVAFADWISTRPESIGVVGGSEGQRFVQPRLGHQPPPRVPSAVRSRGDTEQRGELGLRQPEPQTNAADLVRAGLWR